MERKKINIVKVAKFLIDLIVTFSSIFCFIFVYTNNSDSGYKLMFLFPILFLFCFFLVYRKIIYKKFRIFLSSYTLISYFRYVLMPFFVVSSGYYGGRSAVTPSTDSFILASILMLYELIFVTIVIAIFEIIYKKNGEERKYEKNIILPSKKIVYILFVVLTIGLTILFPQALNMFSFIVPKMSGLDYLKSLPTNLAIVTYTLFTSKFLIFILLMSFLYKKFKLHNSRYYRVLALIVTIFNICIFYGLNRSDLLIPACASIYIYMKLFKDKNVLKYIVIGLVVISIISAMGESRNIYKISNDKMVNAADMMQSYLGGVYNVAISIETKDYFPGVSSITRVFFDTFRPFIGFNILLKNSNISNTNAFFNRRIYFNDHTAQIVPMIGHGYIHFGIIFAPILEIFVIWLAYFLEKEIIKTSRIELLYLFSICLIRMGFFMGQNIGNIANELSMNLVLFLIIYFINNKISLRRLKNVE